MADFVTTLAGMIAEARPKQAPAQRPVPVVPGPLGMSGSMKERNVGVQIEVDPLMKFLGYKTPEELNKIGEDFKQIKESNPELWETIRTRDPYFKKMGPTLAKKVPGFYIDENGIPDVYTRSSKAMLREGGPTPYNIGAGAYDIGGETPSKKYETSQRDINAPYQSEIDLRKAQEDEARLRGKAAKVTADTSMIERKLASDYWAARNRESEQLYQQNLLEAGRATGVPEDQMKSLISLDNDFNKTYRELQTQDWVQNPTDGDQVDYRGAMMFNEIMSNSRKKQLAVVDPAHKRAIADTDVIRYIGISELPYSNDPTKTWVQKVMGTPVKQKLMENETKRMRTMILELKPTSEYIGQTYWQRLKASGYSDAQIAHAMKEAGYELKYEGGSTESAEMSAPEKTPSKEKPQKKYGHGTPAVLLPSIEDALLNMEIGGVSGEQALEVLKDLKERAKKAKLLPSAGPSRLFKSGENR